MATPNPENPLEADIGTQYTNDRAAFNKVRVY
jgi:ubiquitin-protein ligase